MERDESQRRLSRVLSNLLLSVFSFLTLFVLLEVGARVYLMNFLDEKAFFQYATVNQLAKKETLDSQQSKKYAAHRYIGYYPNPNFARDKQSHNSLGFRGAEIVQPKPEGEFRIVCIGGSTTYTEYNFDDELTYPYLLERELHERGYPNVTVINAGFNGWSSWESLVNFEFRVLDLDPDLVIIHHALNDYAARMLWPPDVFLGDNSGHRIPRLTDTFMPPVYEYSTLIRMFLIKFGYTQSHSSLDRNLDAQAPSSYSLDLARQVTKSTYPSGIFKSVSPEEMLKANTSKYFKRNMENLVNMAQFRKIDVVLATIAWSGQFKNEWVSLPAAQNALAEHNHITRMIASEMGVHLFDFATVFPDDKQNFVDGRHVNETGVRLKAKMFADYLVDREIVPK